MVTIPEHHKSASASVERVLIITCTDINCIGRISIYRYFIVITVLQKRHFPPVLLGKIFGTEAYTELLRVH